MSREVLHNNLGFPIMVLGSHPLYIGTRCQSVISPCNIQTYTISDCSTVAFILAIAKRGHRTTLSYAELSNAMIRQTRYCWHMVYVEFMILIAIPVISPYFIVYLGSDHFVTTAREGLKLFTPPPAPVKGNQICSCVFDTYFEKVTRPIAFLGRD